MRVGVLGRTHLLLRAAEAITRSEHEISFVQTCAPEPYYTAGESDFVQLARRAGAPFWSGRSMRDAAARWHATRTDACISLNWPTLIGEETLALFPHGILNAHAGDLPRYRGNASPNWALLNFEAQIGLTIHRMTPELDSGPILYKTYMALDEATYVGDIYAWLEAVIPEAFLAAIGRIAAEGSCEPDPGVRSLRTFPRRPEDSRIDWRAPTRAILALVRASSHPLEGAFTLLENREVVRIFRARAHRPGYDFHAVPGQVCFANGANPVIATADGMIEIEECCSDLGGTEATRRLILRSARNRLV